MINKKYQACPTDGYIRGYPRTSADGRIRMVDRFEDTDGYGLTDRYGYFVYPSADICVNLQWIKLIQESEKNGQNLK